MTRALAVTALILGVLGVILGVSAHMRMSTVAARAVRERETRLIERLWPGMRAVYGDIGASASVRETQPENLEELLAPLFETVNAPDEK